MVNYRPSKPNSPNGTGQVGYALVDFIELYDLGTLTPTPTGTATPPEVCHFHDPLDCDAWNWATSPTPTAVPTTLRALGSSSNLTTAPILTPTNTQGPTPTGVPYFDVACVDCEPDSGCLNVIHYGASEPSPSIAMWREYPEEVFVCTNQYRVDICLTAAYLATRVDGEFRNGFVISADLKPASDFPDGDCKPTGDLQGYLNDCYDAKATASFLVTTGVGPHVLRLYARYAGPPPEGSPSTVEKGKAKPSLQAGGEGGFTIHSVHISPLLEISGTPSNTPVQPTNSPAVTNSPAAPPSLTNTPGGDTPTNTPIGGGDTPTNTPIGGGDTPTNTPAEGGDTPTDVPTGGGDTPTNTPIGGGGDTPTNSPIGGGDTPTSTPIGGGANTPTNTPIGGGSTPTVTATFTPTNTQWPTPTNTDEPWWPPEPTGTATNTPDIAIEFYIDPLFAEPYSDWPQEGSLPRKPKYLCSDTTPIYIQVSGPLGSNPDEAEMLVDILKIYSDSDSTGFCINLLETGENTNVFRNYWPGEGGSTELVRLYRYTESLSSRIRIEGEERLKAQLTVVPNKYKDLMIDRAETGCEWQSDYDTYSPEHDTLNCSDEFAEGVCYGLAPGQLVWDVRFSNGDLNCKESHLSSGGDTQYFDSVDLAVWCGHGYADMGGHYMEIFKDLVDGQKQPADHLYRNEISWGNEDLEWVILNTCRYLQQDYPYEPYPDLRTMCDGVHLICGYSTRGTVVAAAGTTFASLLRSIDPMTNELYTIPAAWHKQCEIHQPPIYAHTSTVFGAANSFGQKVGQFPIRVPRDPSGSDSYIYSHFTCE